MPPTQSLENPILANANLANEALTIEPTQSREIQSVEDPQVLAELQTQQSLEPVSEVSMIDVGTAITQVNKQKSFIDEAFPENQFDASGRQIDPATGQPFPSREQPPPALPPEPISEELKLPDEQKVGKAVFVNDEGQEIAFTQEELKEPTAQDFIREGGFVLSESEGVIPGVVDDPEKQRLQAENQQSAKQVEDLAQDFLSYNINQDPDFKQQATIISAEFERLRRNMERKNFARERAFETRAFRTGAAQFAGDIASGILGEELTQGNQRLADISREESAALSAARIAFKDNKFLEFSRKVDVLRDIRDQKSKALEDYNQTLVDANKALQEFEKAENEATIFAQKQLVFRQEQEVRTADLIAPNILKISEDGELTFDTEEITRIAQESNIDPLVLRASADTQIRELNKLDREERKAELDRRNAESLINARIAAEDRASTLFPFEVQEAIKKATDTSLKPQTIAQIDAIVKSFESSPIVKNFNEVQNKKFSVDRMLVEGEASGPVDLAVVFEFMKALDPTSVVRETEFAAASKSGGIFRGAFKKFNGEFRQGEFLPENVKKEFQKLMGDKFVVAEAQLGNLFDEKARLINRKTGDTDGADFLPEFRFDINKERAKSFNTVGDFLNIETGGTEEQMLDFQSRLRESGIDEANSEAVEEAFKIYKKSFLVDDLDKSKKGSELKKDIKTVNIGNRQVQISSQVRNNLLAADEIFFQATGQHLQINQDFRTKEQQQALFDRLSPQGARVAPPGTSFHEKGLAIDVTNWKEAEPFLRAFGFVNDLADDKGHFSIGEFIA